MIENSVTPLQPWMQQSLSDGFRALNEGNTRKASWCCQKVLKLKPDLTEAHFLVGLIALELQDRKTAIHAFGSVTTLNKHHSAGWANLAKEFMNSGQINRADHALKEAVNNECGEHTVQGIIGEVYTKFGEYDSAHYWLKKALENKPDNIAYAVNLVNCLLYLDKKEEFNVILADVFAMVPDHAQSHFLLSTARKATSDKHVQELEQLLANKQLQPMSKAFLYYALGKELEDLQEWERAFIAFEQGAKVRRSIIQYDEQNQVDVFNALKEVYTPEWLAARSRGCEDSSPIFVLGQPRTGTTLVERIIASHSQVHSAGELQQFTMALRRLLNYQKANWYSPELMRASAHIDGEAIGEMYLHTSLKMRGTSTRFVDKMPPNFHYIPLILKALPNAKIVHLCRHPMDTCFANYKQLFADAYLHSYDQCEMARHYARYYHLMEVWRERFPNQFFDVSYEDVVIDLENQARRLIDYLQLPWEDSCLSFHQQSTAVATASTVQVREPAHTRSVNRWRRYENQLSPMLETLHKEGIDI